MSEIDVRHESEVDVVEAEVVDTEIVIDEIPVDAQPMSRAEAEALAEALEEAAETIVELAVRAWTGQAWKVLDYPSWEAFAADKLRHFRQLRLGSERVRAQRELVAAGMSQRAIGGVFGVNQSSVSRARRRDPEAAAPEATTGLDGRVRKAAKKPPAKVIPRRKFNDDFFQVVKLLIRDGERLKKLMRDDRWPEFRRGLGEQYDSDMERVQRAIEAMRAQWAVTEAEAVTPEETDSTDATD